MNDFLPTEALWFLAREYAVWGAEWSAYALTGPHSAHVFAPFANGDELLCLIGNVSDVL